MQVLERRTHRRSAEASVGDGSGRPGRWHRRGDHRPRRPRGGGGGKGESKSSCTCARLTLQRLQLRAIIIRQQQRTGPRAHAARPAAPLRGRHLGRGGHHDGDHHRRSVGGPASHHRAVSERATSGTAPHTLCRAVGGLPSSLPRSSRRAGVLLLWPKGGG